MSQLPAPRDPLSVLTAQAHAHLAEASHTPFSRAAFLKLQDKIDQYIGDLIFESVRIMERRQADTVSPVYVQQASENLVAGSRRRFFAIIGTVGGVLLGTGVATYSEMVTRGSTTIAEVLFASSMTAVGVLMVALQFTRD